MSRVLVGAVLLALVLLALSATSAAADDPVRTASAPAALQAAPAAPATTAVTPKRARLSAERAALVAVEEQGRREVDALLQSMKGLPEGPALAALERKVEEVKQATRVSFLRVKVDFALRRGDLATADAARRAIARILEPPAPIVTPVTRPEPAPRTEEGGRP